MDFIFQMPPCSLLFLSQLWFETLTDFTILAPSLLQSHSVSLPFFFLYTLQHFLFRFLSILFGLVGYFSSIRGDAHGIGKLSHFLNFFSSFLFLFPLDLLTFDIVLVFGCSLLVLSRTVVFGVA